MYSLKINRIKILISFVLALMGLFSFTQPALADGIVIPDPAPIPDPPPSGAELADHPLPSGFRIHSRPDCCDPC